MSSNANRYVTIVAVLVLIASIPVAWEIAEVRADQATEKRASDLVRHRVPTWQAPGDYDGDGVADDADRCPTRPETTNGFQDGDGCPDIVATTGAS